jgi:RecB family endonuclease NucS
MATNINAYKYLLYIKSSKLEDRSETPIRNLLEKLSQQEKALTVKVVDASKLTDTDQEKIAVEIRSIPPQARGRVVSGGGMILALSHAKKLNFDNTPIIIVKDNLDRPIAVFPHALEGKVETVEDHLKDALALGVDEALHRKRIPTEEILTELISTMPSIFENDATVIGHEYPTSTGTIDLLLLDKNGTPIVVEVEVTATEQAIGQVHKLAEGYSKTAETVSLESDITRLAREKPVRKAIICLKTKGRLQEACRSAGIELYQLKAERLP